jgi:hypothetical protein
MSFEWRASTLASEAILPVREVVTWVRAEVRVLFLAFTRATFIWAAFLRICTLRTRRDSVLADTVKVLASKARCDLARLAQVSAISLLLLGEADGDNGFCCSVECSEKQSIVYCSVVLFCSYGPLKGPAAGSVYMTYLRYS